ncbi:hypothetical protein LMG27174_03553 [Paraburkholderia rhynchosiae]|nr:hypothetical protein [Paraburkholderia rhynchosiae]CAB3698622.1 hypothetical protein LMG27174_03553 [Paraburkholderia rhynchosiae]
MNWRIVEIRFEALLRQHGPAYDVQCIEHSRMDVAKTRFPLFAFRWLMRDRYDNVSKIGRVRVPVLGYGGLADHVIPPALFAALYAAIRAPARLMLIDQANHVDVWQRGGREHVLHFLRDVHAKALL